MIRAFLVWLDTLLYDIFVRYDSPWDRLTPEQQQDAVFKAGVGR